LAPAGDEHITAGWVQAVARELERDRTQRILMNTPSGSPQAPILGYLDDAAAALEENQYEYAKDLVGRALGVLDDVVESGWVSPSQIKPIKQMIVSSFKRAAHGDTGDAAKQDDDKGYGPQGDRWTGYTENRRLGLTKSSEFDWRARQDSTKSEGRDSQEESSSYRDRSGSHDQQPRSRDEQGQGDRGGTARYYTDDFYYPDAGNTPSRSGDEYQEATDQRIYRDRAQHQRGRERFYHEDRGTYDGEQPLEDRVYTD